MEGRWNGLTSWGGRRTVEEKERYRLGLQREDRVREGLD